MNENTIYFVASYKNDKTYDIINEQGENVIGSKVLSVSYLSSDYIFYISEDYNRHIYNLKTKKTLMTFDKKVTVSYYCKNIFKIKKRESDFYVTNKLYDYVKNIFSKEYVELEFRDEDKYSIFLDLTGNIGLLSNDTFEEVLQANAQYDKYRYIIISSIEHPEYDVIEEKFDNYRIVYSIKSLNTVKKIYTSDHKHIAVDVKDDYIIIEDNKNFVVFDIDGLMMINKYLYSYIKYIGKNKFIVEDIKSKKIFIVEIIDKNFKIINKISENYEYISEVEQSSKNKDISKDIFEVSKIKDRYKTICGLINRDGKIIADLKYSYITYLKE